MEESANTVNLTTWGEPESSWPHGHHNSYDNKIILYMIHLLRAHMASLTKCFPFARIIFNIMHCPAQILTFLQICANCGGS